VLKRGAERLRHQKADFSGVGEDLLLTRVRCEGVSLFDADRFEHRVKEAITRFDGFLRDGVVEDRRGGMTPRTTPRYDAGRRSGGGCPEEGTWALVAEVSVDRCSRRYRAGGVPKWRLKARLNAASDS